MIRVLRRIRWPGWVLIIFIAITFFYISGSMIGANSQAVPTTKKVADHKLKETVLHSKQFLVQKDSEVIKSLDRNKKYIALTFDDGPSSDVTPQVLEALEEYDVKATFFMLGSQAKANPSMARAVAKAGHEIGNHTNSHQNLVKLDTYDIKEEFSESARNIEEASGQYPTMSRPPYGKFDKRVEETATALRNSLILWSVDSMDWKTRNAKMINEEILNSVTPGAIVLMHDIHQETADALPELLSALINEGYQFVTVSEILSLSVNVGTGLYYKVNY
ncbi:polysaccharide deacetylase family protein [Gracilibacillus alcaliphilus]|uniref:polysaccharide deacetylase family protein n=1 Tax=Gracilibacillus alcaliphilus TaxID=1401441 RepID=UPI001958D858|nr:polysaccharide deacetylase family protein [Gracilibacillus alcaliphilus]MBM7675638.1 peptidoglycan/xylan/chitin deacetylase (PgdA/CDA1 family) [Gracilibacillus alcaliphilus]